MDHLFDLAQSGYDRLTCGVIVCCRYIDVDSIFHPIHTRFTNKKLTLQCVLIQKVFHFYIKISLEYSKVVLYGQRYLVATGYSKVLCINPDNKSLKYCQEPVIISIFGRNCF